MPAQKDKTSTTARLEVLSGPAAAVIEPRKNKAQLLQQSDHVKSNIKSSISYTMIMLMYATNSSPVKAFEGDKPQYLRPPTDKHYVCPPIQHRIYTAPPDSPVPYGLKLSFGS